MVPGGVEGVGELLAKIEGSRFDPALYLHSTRYADCLISRGRNFLAEASGAQHSAVDQQILAALRDWGSNEAAAYRAYAGTRAFEDLPFISKGSLQSDPESFVTPEGGGDIRWSAKTFGTTSAPVSLTYSSEFYFEYLHLTIWKLTRELLRAEKREVFVVSIDNKPGQSDFVTLDPSGMTGLGLKVHIDEMNSETLDRLFRIIDQLNPAVIVSRPSVFEALVSYWQTIGHAKFAGAGFKPLGVFSAGSFLTETSRNEVAEVFRAPVRNCYGLAEFGYVGGECATMDGYHIDSSSCHVEVVDRAGSPVADQRGEIVISSLLNRAMPLIRFRTGDFGRVTRQICKCGSAQPRLLGIEGHGPFYFEWEDGSKTHPSRIYALRWLFPIEQFQVVQTELDAILIKVRGLRGARLLETSGLETFIRQTVPGAKSIRVENHELTDVASRERFVSTRPFSMVGRDLLPG